MNDGIKTQISAFVDGELPENEAELLLRRMCQDRELRQQAAEYLAMGRIIRGERIVAGTAHLRNQISAAIDDSGMRQDPGHAQTGSPRYLRPVAGVAIAATVALAAILGLQQMAGVNDIDESRAPDAVADVSGTGYTVPDPAEDQLREYYLRHTASSSYIGVDSINARLVTLELRDGVLVETQPATESEEDTNADSGDAAPDQTP